MTTRRVALVTAVLSLCLAACSSTPTCTAGQVLKDGACVAEVTCGAGTTAVDGRCVADVVCAPGTRAQNGQCVAVCASGTTSGDGGCVPDVVCGPGTTAMNGACVPDILCGPGTMAMNGRCVPICAQGTMSTDGGCVPDVVCGPGTTAMNGRCVPDVTCGPGTRASGGACVPDGTVICTQGTRFDLDAGTCVVDPTACANGTTLVGTVCTPDDQLLMGAADLVELEPADGGTVSGVLPTMNLDAGVTFYGCVDPADAGADTDVWMVTVAEPTLLDIRVDGIGGLAAGFAVLVGDPALTQLNGFARYAVNLSGDTSQREVYLPLAGTYGIFVADSRQLLGGFPAGSPTSCYFGTVARRTLPAPQPATLGPQQATADGHVRVLSVSIANEGAIFDSRASSATEIVTPAFVTLAGNTFRAHAYVATSMAPAESFVGGLAAGETVTLVLDPQINLGLQPVSYDLDLAITDAVPLPVTGSTVMVTARNGTTPGAPLRDLNYFYFDVAAPQVLAFNLSGSVPLDMMVLRRDIVAPATRALDVLAAIDAFGGAGRASFANEHLRFLQAGRYYFVVQNPTATAGAIYTLTSSVSVLTPTPATSGMTVSNASLPATGSAFVALDLTSPVWLEYGVVGTTDWGAGNVVLTHYAATAEGWLRTGTGTGVGNVFPLFTSQQPSVAPFSPRARIHLGDPNEDYLVRVSSSAASGMAPTFSLQVRDRPNVVNLGTLPSGMTVPSTITGLVSGAPARFIALARPGDAFRTIATPANMLSDVRLDRVDANETSVGTANAAGPGGAETLTYGVPTAPVWVAWTVTNLTMTATDVSLATSATPPRPYVISSGMLPFVDACAGGTTLGTNLDDQLFTGQTLPMAFASFQLFGEPVPATFRVAANGWLSWDTGTVSFGGYQNRAIPTGTAPNGVLAPFWQDQDQVTLCRRDDAMANTVTFQWTGRVFQVASGQGVQYQTVLHATGVIDFIYGPNHQSNGAFVDTDGNGATVGAENLGGTFGHQLLLTQPLALPNTSYTLTPQ